jgi:hypothetical protein
MMIWSGSLSASGAFLSINPVGGGGALIIIHSTLGGEAVMSIAFTDKKLKLRRVSYQLTHVGKN